MTAAAAQAVCPRAASAKGPDNLSGILERAERGTLRTTPILSRARADKLVDPKELNSCKQITALIEADSEVLYDLLPAARTYLKSKLEESNNNNEARRLLTDIMEDEVSKARLDHRIWVTAHRICAFETCSDRSFRVKPSSSS